MLKVTRIFERITIVLLLVAGGLHAQENNGSVIDRHIDIDQRFKAGTWEAVHLLAAKGIPIGFEARGHWNIDTDPRVVLKSGKLEDVLDSIVRQDVFYTWIEVGGVINVYPIMDRNEGIRSLLDKRLGPIKIRTGDGRASTVQSIERLFVSTNKIDVRFYSVIGAGNSLGLPDKFEKDISMPESDLRTVLNSIAKEQAYSPIWTVYQYPGKDEISVVF